MRVARPDSTLDQAGCRPRRSVLYVPGANSRALEKAPALDADGWILDLEDAVAPDAKEAARAAVARVLGGVLEGALGGALGGGFPREVAVRINAHGTPWRAADLAVAATADAVVLPKVRRAADVADASAELDRLGSAARLWLMVETPGAVLDLPALVGGSERVEVLVMGNNDLAAALRLPPEDARTGLVTSLSRTVLVARDTGCEVLDGVFDALADPEGLQAECRHGRALGFDGKTVIHPAQIAIANEMFGPGAAEVAAARSLVVRWGDATGGVIQHEGRIAEQLHVDAARRTLAIHAAISARSQAATEG